uniref:Uncharacterized protein n=1 Tax=Craspedostauros australis TaxID=1486917 RepID=A0A7R9WR41_9STRA|mmetsp:Transcript_14955/g.41432  ORF Transcript_14955/g.41432 Transcript_14955/m.41432 type:complete len:103 (+) Transcript_14955:106-414(+)
MSNDLSGGISPSWFHTHQMWLSQTDDGHPNWTRKIHPSSGVDEQSQHRNGLRSLAAAPSMSNKGFGIALVPYTREHGTRHSQLPSFAAVIELSCDGRQDRRL